MRRAAILCRMISGVPNDFHISACFARMRSTTFSPVAPTRMGGCDRRSGLGLQLASRNWMIAMPS